MDIFHQWIRHAILAYGYQGVFASLMLGMFGLPVPDETILTFTGFLIHRNILLPAPAFLAAYLGSICGITLNYLVGRCIGLPLLQRYGVYLHLSWAQLDRAHRWFARHGNLALFFGYFFPGLRHLTALAAGASCLEFRRFAPYAYSGGLCWVATFLVLGYVLGQDWHKVTPQTQSYLLLLAGFVVFLVIGYYLGLLLRHRRRPK